MKPAFAVLVLLASLVAGCSGDPRGEPTPMTDFSDLEGQVTATTGILRGVVVDERIIPVVGADVGLSGGQTPNQTTDDQGRFLFSGLEPGTYFVQVRSKLHTSQQTSAEVIAGEAEPKIVRILVERLFKQDPYVVQVVREGFFQCSQAGAGLYASSNCVYDPYRWAFGPGGSPTQPVDNVTTQQREWHSDVGAGWQSLVFEMEWTPTSQGTSANMGIIVSTYKPERDGAHHFARLIGPSPLRGQIDVGVEHETASGVDPTTIPPEGLVNMSYFVSVQQGDLGPGLAINQQFKLYLTMFHYGTPPEGWSIVNGDPLPF